MLLRVEALAEVTPLRHDAASLNITVAPNAKALINAGAASIVQTPICTSHVALVPNVSVLHDPQKYGRMN